MTQEAASNWPVACENREKAMESGEDQTLPLAAVLDAASARYLVTSRAPKEKPASRMGASGYIVRRPATAT